MVAARLPHSGQRMGRPDAMPEQPKPGRTGPRPQPAGLHMGQEPPREQQGPQGHARQHRRGGQDFGCQRHLAARCMEGHAAGGGRSPHLPGGPHGDGRLAEAGSGCRLPGRPRCRGRRRDPRGGDGPAGPLDQAHRMPQWPCPPLPLADGRPARVHPQWVLPGGHAGRPRRCGPSPRRMS